MIIIIIITIIIIIIITIRIFVKRHKVVISGAQAEAVKQAQSFIFKRFGTFASGKKLKQRYSNTYWR